MLRALTVHPCQCAIHACAFVVWPCSHKRIVILPFHPLSHTLAERKGALISPALALHIPGTPCFVFSPCWLRPSGLRHQRKRSHCYGSRQNRYLHARDSCF